MRRWRALGAAVVAISTTVGLVGGVATPAGAATVTFATYTDGSGTHDLEMDITTPGAGSGRPAVVLVSGGGFSSMDRVGIASVFQQPFLDAGFVVATPDYRVDPNLASLGEDPSTGTRGTLQCDFDDLDGSPTCPADGSSTGAVPYDKAAPWDDLIAAERQAQHDVQAAIRYLRANAATYGIDTSKIVILGASAGGIIALDVLYRSDDPGTVGSHLGQSSSVAAAVSLVGYAREADQDAGEGPALLVNSTDEGPAVEEVWDFDPYDEAREVLERADDVGNVVQLASTCRSGHGPALSDYTETVARMVQFAQQAVAGTVADEGRWSGDLVSSGTRLGGQDMIGPHIPLVGDFDGSGEDDVLWWGKGGSCGDGDLWVGGGDSLDPEPFTVTDAAGTSTETLPSSGTPYVGDFDGDGSRDDLFFYNPSVSYFGDIDGSGDVVFRKVSRTVWLVSAPVVGDFDGDGIDDLLWSTPGTGGDTVVFGRSNRGWTQVLTTDRTGSEKPVVGDYDGDGDDDVYWWGSGTATDDMWFSNGSARTFTATTPTGSQIDSPGLPRAGDLDGNGLDDLFAYGSTSSRSYFSISGGTVSVNRVAMTIWTVAVPLVGRFDGDTKADIVLYGPGTYGDVYWKGGSGTTLTSVTPFAVTGSYGPVVGDYDGDADLDILWDR